MRGFAVMLLASLVWGLAAAAGVPQPSELFLRGYSVIPTPQKAVLAEDFVFDGSWAYDAGAVAPRNIAVTTLVRDLREFHAINLRPAAGSGPRTIRLIVAKDAVNAGGAAAIQREAYRLKLAPGRIEITGNSGQGLFYGVQTFLQLLKPTGDGKLRLPAGTIEDWPAFPLRFLHWNTNEHQDRVETLKRYLDWSARFKANAIGFDLEDNFEYPSNPIIGAPGALTAAQMQELVDYGLERFIQIVPQPQAPAHMSYALKHPQFAGLREDGNNYQACLCDEGTYRLIFQMYDDLIKATNGVDYFFVSTDEVYYAGMDARCGKPFTPENKSAVWMQFVRRAAEFMKSRNRTMLFWLSDWVLPEHLKLLPEGMINAWGIHGNERRKIELEMARQVQRLGYASMEGMELLFPDYFPASGSTGNLETALQAIPLQARAENMVGVFGAAWDDAGVHNETFWLGWAALAQYGWAPGTPPVEQTVADFMNIYYGPHVTDMAEVYRGLQEQARFFEKSWDRVVSRVRGPGYGSSFGKGVGTARHDYTLPPPALPSAVTLEIDPVYAGRRGELLDRARRMAAENDSLRLRLGQNMLRASRNRYNLEVLLALADFTRHHDRMIAGMGEIESKLLAARKAGAAGDPKAALAHLVAAQSQGRGIAEERRGTFQHVKVVWEKSQHPKGRSFEGRPYVNVFDDTKDYFAGRRPDLSFMVAPEESMDLDGWTKRLWSVIVEYALANKLPVPPAPDTEWE